MAEVVALNPGVSPVEAYLGKLLPSGRRTMATCAENIQRIFPRRWQDYSPADATYLRQLIAEKYPNANSANKHLACFRGILGAAFDLGMIDGERFMALCRCAKAFKKTKKVTGRMLEQGEVDALFEACELDTPLGARDAAVLSCLVSGLRREEIAGLNVENYQQSQDGSVILNVLGKGQKQRQVPLPMGCILYMERWLLFRSREPGPLFVHVNPKFGEEPNAIRGMFRISDSLVYRIIARLEAVARVAHASPHDMRRTLASNLLDVVDPNTVKEILGHEDVSTTMKYDRRKLVEKMKSAMEKVNVPQPKGKTDD